MTVTIKTSGLLQKNNAPVTKNIVPLVASDYVLLPHHLEEWLNSGVSEDIVRLNVFSIAGQGVKDHLGITKNDTSNSWRYASVIFQGGWICDFIMKPDNPRKVRKKLVKYESPIGSETRPVELKLPEEIWQAIAQKFGVPKPLEQDGWDWVKQNPQIPIVVCEGVKKAGCVITQTLTPAIALPGHTTACERDSDTVRFDEYVHPERQIILCFDRDQTENAAKSVAHTIKSIGWRLHPNPKKRGKKAKPKAQLKICTWFTCEKGIDDIWYNSGAIGVQEIIDNAISWDIWVDDSASILGFEPNVQFNSPRWKPIELPEDSHLIVVKGAKGTGKTWFLEQLTKQARDQKRPSIAITHRIQLSKALAERLDLTYIEDIEGKIDKATNITLCIDSLAKIEPKKFANGIIIIDEAVQVLEHFLVGETCAYKRQSILLKFRELAKLIIETGGKFIIADADMNSATVQFFIGLLGEERPYIIENTYREPSYTCFLSDGFRAFTDNGGSVKTPADIVSTALQMAKEGKHIFIACTGQKEESKWGSITLEALFLLHGISSVIRIDSDTVTESGHPAFGAARKINTLCNNYQVIIGTPTLGTGLSIENQYKFDAVFGIFTGVGSPDSARQFLMRIRDKTVPRYIYAADYGLDKTFNNLGYNPKVVNNRVKELKEFQENILKEHDSEWCEEYKDIKHCNTTSVYFNNLVATRNNENFNFKEYVRHGLKSENVNVIDIKDIREIYETDIDPQEIYEQAGTLTEDNIKEYRTKLAAQVLLEQEEYEKLKNATELTETERVKIEATVLSNKYGGIPVTEELAAKDSAGWYDQIKLHYACTVGLETQRNIQALIGNTQLRRGDGEVLEHDFISRQNLLGRAEFIQASEILDLIGNNHTFSKVDEESTSFYDDMVEQVPNINLIFNKNIKSTVYKSGEFNFKLIKLIGNFIGAKSVNKSRTRINGEQERQYGLTIPEDGRNEIYTRWLQRDKETEQKWFIRKREWETQKLVNQIKSDISLNKFAEIKQAELFTDAWERVHTNIRIQIINRVDNFTIPENKKVIVNALNKEAVALAFCEINNWSIVSLDCETFGNDPKNKEGLHKFKAQLRLLLLSNGYITYIFDFGERGSNTRTEALANVAKPLQSIINRKSKTIIGHNLNFDLGILLSNFNLEVHCQVSDTRLGIQVFTGIYNGLNAWEGGYGLGTLTEKFLGVKVDKTEQKSDWGATLTPSQIAYAASDPHITYWLWIRILALYQNPDKFGFGKLAKWDMKEYWDLENSCLIPIARMEAYGIPICLDTLLSLQEKVENQLTETLAKWTQLNTGIDKPSQVAKLVKHLNAKYELRLTKGDKKALGDLKHLDEVQLRFTHSGLLQYQARLKKLIKSAETHGRAKTFYSVLSGTGRTSSGGKFDDIVNIQSIPAKVDDSIKNLGIPSIRSAFKSSEDKVLIVADLAAAHARIACDFAKDQLGMIVQNNDSVDAHSLFAIKIAQCVPDKFEARGLPKKFLGLAITVNDKELLNEFKNSGSKITICKQLRDVAKNIFYGKLNGASWKRVQAELSGQLKIQTTDSEAQAISKCFEELYPELTTYCQIVAKKLELPENQIWIDGKLFGISEIAETNNRLLFYITDKEGNISIPFTNVVASQWSRTEATAMKKAMVLCSKLLDKHPEWEAKLVNIVHDELNVECNKQYAHKVAKTVAWVMARYFQLELKNGVTHGCVDFTNEHLHKYLINENDKKIEDARFKTSIYSMIVTSWADKT